MHIESFDIIRDMRGYYIHLGFDILIMMIDFILIEASEAVIFRASLIISVCYIDIADLY